MVAIWALLDRYVLGPHFPARVPYLDAEISHTALPGVAISSLVSRRDQGVFIYRATPPKKLYLKLRFDSAERITAVVRGFYPEKHCLPEQAGAAVMFIAGATVNQKIELEEQTPHLIKFYVSRGETVRFTLRQEEGHDCGQARVALFEHQSRSSVDFLFLGLWSLLILLCVASKTTLIVPLFGASFSAVMLLAESTMSDKLVMGNVISSLGAGLGLAGVLTLLAAVPLRSRLLSLGITLFLVASFWPPLVFVAYQAVFDAPVNPEVLHAILQSYPQQVMEFWGEYVGTTRTALGGLLVLFVYFCSRRINRSSPSKYLAVITGSLMLLLCGLLIINRTDDSKLRSLILQSVESYRHELRAFRTIANKRLHEVVPAALAPEFSDNLTVVAMGESVNRNHLSAYDYVRDTTPNLDRRLASGEAVRFENAYANHTHSNPTLTFVLTQANQYNDRSWLQSPSILHLAATASVPTTWLSNHRMLGKWSNQITALASDADRVTTINERIGTGNFSTRFDGDLLPLFRDAVQRQSRQLVFLHFYNSHVGYCNRYPESARMYSGDIRGAYFGAIATEPEPGSEAINCYDNSIYYTDELLEKVITTLQSREQPSVLVYLADHGEDVFRHRAHNASLFTFAMTEIPLFVWANEAWRTQHPGIWQNLKANSREVFTNDLVYETVLGLMGISSPAVNLEHDLSAANYVAPPRPRTLHGKMPIDGDTNWRHWQRDNAAVALSKGVQLGALDVDSIGKAKVALGLGVDVLELQVRYTSSGELQVVNARGEAIGIELHSFIEQLRGRPLNSLIITLPSDQSTDSVGLDLQLQELAGRYSVSISRHMPEGTMLALGSPDFQQQLKRLGAHVGRPQMVEVRTPFDPPR